MRIPEGVKREQDEGEQQTVFVCVQDICQLIACRLVRVRESTPSIVLAVQWLVVVVAGGTVVRPGTTIVHMGCVSLHPLCQSLPVCLQTRANPVASVTRNNIPLKRPKVISPLAQNMRQICWCETIHHLTMDIFIKHCILSGFQDRMLLKV